MLLSPAVAAATEAEDADVGHDDFSAAGCSALLSRLTALRSLWKGRLNTGISHMSNVG